MLRRALFLLLFVLPLFARQAERDAIAAKAFPADRPGAAVLVMKGGQSGVYRVDENVARTISVEEGRIYSQRSGAPRAELVPVGKDEFVFRESSMRLTFERDAAGKVTAMIVDDGRTKTRAPRT
ncbi:MAG TPA: hypothetical protein VEO54_10410 [Thermoanaerobaculia bacterium]|nr:hypothetical protein [Thermoanaerobaculia bacterium]